MSDLPKLDYAIIGGGFYGTSIALHLRELFPSAVIAIFERGESLMLRASYTNQARVHNGYHYPRSFITAYRSRINSQRFLDEFHAAIKKDFTKLYCIARANSKVNPAQFVRFSKEIGAKIKVASPHFKKLFNQRLIEEVFEVEEYAFDATKIAARAREEIRKKDIGIYYNTEISEVFKRDGYLQLESYSRAKVVFNTSYSGINKLKGDFKGTKAVLKHEITEMALISPPPQLANVGVTVMDGAFFSMMPFPAQGLHSISHVRFTPHLHWIEDGKQNPYKIFDEYKKVTRYDRMARDAVRYLPAISQAEYKSSIFEIKTVLMKNETDDGRPILFETYDELKHFYTILGGKVDNIYDVLDRINEILKSENL